ncbi:MAG: hypothetical protein GPJ54_16265 [Candidatus Heimdallarchaeota archaeon]|nr:hypothetical protein [Candidatus Heimdallarchaeota archaeon]
MTNQSEKNEKWKKIKLADPKAALFAIMIILSVVTIVRIGITLFRFFSLS